MPDAPGPGSPPVEGPDLLAAAKEMFRQASRKCADGFWEACTDHDTCLTLQRWARAIVAEAARRSGPDANPGPDPPAPAPAAPGEGCPETCGCGGAWGKRGNALIIGTPHEGPCPWREARRERERAEKAEDRVAELEADHELGINWREKLDVSESENAALRERAEADLAEERRQHDRDHAIKRQAMTRFEEEQKRAEAAEARCLWLTDAGEANDHRATVAEDRARRLRAAIGRALERTSINQEGRDILEAALSAPGPEREPDPPTGGGP